MLLGQLLRKEWQDEFFGLVIAVTCLLFYLHWYARKVQQNPQFSYSYDDRDKFDQMWGMTTSEEKDQRFTLKRKLF